MSDQVNKSGDSDELQALFDSIVSASSSTPKAPDPVVVVAPVSQPPAPVESPAPTMENFSGSSDAASKAMFSSIGMITRKVHDALRELGYDKSLEKAAAAIPDARDRLTYVATLTEQAANRTLNAVDAAQPLQNKIESDADALASQWDKLYNKQLSVEEFKQLAAKTREHLKFSANSARSTNEQLLEIMMAQDFQDLTGQVIKKIVDMAKDMESSLIDFLKEHAPQAGFAVTPTVAPALENGPVINPEGRSDVVTSQEQVDDLLASLGF